MTASELSNSGNAAKLIYYFSDNLKEDFKHVEITSQRNPYSQGFDALK